MPRISIPLMLACLALCCTRTVDGPLPPGPRDPARNLDLLEAFADRTLREGQLSSWERSLGSSGSTRPFGRRPLRDLRADELWSLRAALPSAEDQRRIDLVERRSRQVQLASDPEVKAALVRLDTVRARFPLDDPALHRVLLESGDEGERREAWLALHSGTDELAPLVVELTKARRGWARRAGHDSALRALLEVNGPSAETAARLRERLEAALRPLAGTELVEPWNSESFDPVLAGRLAAALPAEGLLARGVEVSRWLGATPTRVSTTMDLSGYSANASFAIDPPADVRIRVTPETGLAGAWRVFHELGHAAQARLAPVSATPMQQRRRSGAVAEGCAKLAERLAWSPEWLRGLGLSDADLAAVTAWEAQSERARGRRILADASFEELLHDEPDAALDALHRETWATVAGLRSPPEVSAWAAQPALTHEPGKRLDYLFARCAQAAIYRRLRAQPGGLLGEPAARLLREEILPGAAGASYEEWVLLSTGEQPHCEAWLEDVARLP